MTPRGGAGLAVGSLITYGVTSGRSAFQRSLRIRSDSVGWSIDVLQSMSKMRRRGRGARGGSIVASTGIG